MIITNQVRERRSVGAEAPRGHGGVVVIAGPDGAGKSTLSRALVDALPGPVTIVHHRPGILPGKSGTGVVTDPRAHRPYGRLASLLKVLYVWADYRLGWALRIRPFARNGWVIVERGWSDLLVDPLRYRLTKCDRVLGLLRRFVPRPDVSFVLEAPAPILAARKQELPLDELTRQMRVWRNIQPPGERTVYLDASDEPGALLAAAIAAVGRAERDRIDARSRAGWATLPSRRSGRWVVPRGPRQVAAASLRIYHPVTLRGFIGWHAARGFAAAGGFRLLPRGKGPAPEVLTALAPHAAAELFVALEKGHTSGSWIALLIDGRGRCRSVGSVATSPESRRRLEQKRAATSALPRLPAPLEGPRIVAEAPSVLLFEPVAWRPRIRAWRLPAGVAAAMGTYFRANASSGSVGPAHRDFAPWNILRSRSGWAVLDWDDASWHEEAPFQDLFHYLVQSHALLRRPSQRKLVAGLEGRGWVGNAIRAYAEAAARPVADARACLIAYLETSIPRVDLSMPEGRRELLVRRRLLGELAPDPAREDR